MKDHVRKTAPCTPESPVKRSRSKLYDTSESDKELDDMRERPEDPSECRAPIKRSLDHSLLSDHSNVPKFSIEVAADEFTEDDLKNIDNAVIQHQAEPAKATDGGRSTLNKPIEMLNEQMNLYMPPLKDEHGNDLISVNLAVKGNQRYVNVRYTGKPQKFLVGTGQRLYKFAAMSPFARTRYVDPLPYGSFKNRWNDPNSETYRQSKFKISQMASSLQFQLTNERLSEDELENKEANPWLAWNQQVDSMVFEQVLKNLNKFFPSIHSQIQKNLDKVGMEMTRENVRRELLSVWKGLVETDPKTKQIQYMQFSQKLFRFASDQEQAKLSCEEFQCRSGDPELTQLLKNSLVQIPANETKPQPRWENDLKLYRCLSNEERLSNPEGSPFVRMTYEEERDLFSDKNSIVSVAYEFSLGCNDTKITLRHDPIGIIWLGKLDLFERAPVLANPSAIRFDCIH